MAEMESLKAEVAGLRSELAGVTQVVKEIRSLVGPFGVTMPDGTMLVQTLFGTKYLIDPSDLIMAPNLIIYRQWEADLSAFFTSATSPNTVFVDVGANFGYFTCLVGSKIGRSGTGRVIAVEPNPACVDLLTKNVRINWSMSPIELFAGAVGATSGQAKLAVPKNRAANASMSVEQISDDVTLVDVDLRTLDSLVPNGLTVDMMKVDVEGHEYAVLQGARETIANSPSLKIVMEWSVAQTKAAGYTPEDLVNLFRQLGLTPYHMPRSLAEFEATPRPFDHVELLQMPYENILLTSR